MSKDSIFNMYAHIRKTVTEEKLEKSIGKAWSVKNESKERLDDNVKSHIQRTLGLNESEPIDVDKTKVNKAIKKMEGEEIEENSEVQPYAGNEEIPAEKELDDAGPNKKIADNGEVQEKKGDHKIKDINNLKKATDTIVKNKYSKTKSYTKQIHTQSKAKQGGLKPGYKAPKVKESVSEDLINSTPNTPAKNNSKGSYSNMNDVHRDVQTGRLKHNDIVDLNTRRHQVKTSNGKTFLRNVHGDYAHLEEDFNNGQLSPQQPVGPSNPGNKQGKEVVLGTFTDEKVAQDLARERHGDVVKDEKQNIWKVTVKEGVELLVVEDGEPKAIVSVDDSGEVNVGAIETETAEEAGGSPTDANTNGEVPVPGEVIVDEEEPIGYATEVPKQEGPLSTDENKVEEGKKVPIFDVVPGDKLIVNGKAVGVFSILMEMDRTILTLDDKSQHVFGKDSYAILEESEELEDNFGEKPDLNKVPGVKGTMESKIKESADDFTVGYSESLQKSLKDVLGVSVESSKVVSKLKTLERPELEILKKAMEMGDVDALRHFLNSVLEK